jgi:hypothetical protein
MTEQQLDLFDEMTAPAVSPRKGEYLVPATAEPGSCTSCGAMILWIRTPQDRAIPLSVATIQHRNGQRYALSHFADCPDGKEWRKR